MKTVKKNKLRNERPSALRKVSATVSILGMIWSSSAIANTKNPSNLDMFNQVFDSTMAQMQQSMQQNQMMTQQAAMMSQLQPQTIPSKYFPHCKISQAKGAFPKRACSGGVSSPQHLSSVEQMSNLGNTYSDMYEQLLSPAQNSAYPVGLQCLENAKKGMVKSLVDRMNSLQGLKDKIEKEAQFFEAQNKKLLSDMDKSHKELFGGTTGDIDARTQDFSKYFDQNCQNIIGADNLANASSAGLNGLRVQLLSSNKTAVNYTLNRSSIENDINKQIQTVKNQINSQGIQQWRDDVAKGDASINGQDLARMGVNKPAVGIVMTEINRFESKVSNIQKELKKIDPNYEIPSMDKNFGVDFAEFTNGAEDFFKKKYINECVTMADQGVAISTEQVLGSLKSSLNGGGQVALKNYKAALQNILNSDAFIEDKMLQIKQLDERFSGSKISISYKNGISQTVTSSPYELYRTTANNCAQKFAQDDTFTTNGQKGVSQQKKIARAKEYLNDLKDLEATFANQIGNKIYDSVMNCSGRSEKPATCSSTEVFNQDSDAFCMKHASSCSQKVQACYNKANNLVEQKKMNIKSMQATYNKNVTALVAREEAYLNQVKQQVLADAEYLSKYFPGANYKLPEGLFIKMPEIQESEFGVELAGGGSLDFMKDLPEQIGKLKDTLGAQSDEIEKEIGNYILSQKEAMETQKSKWEDFSNDCYSAAQDFRKEVANSNAQMQQAQQEQMGRVGEFCQKFGQLGNANPAAGCDEGSNSASQLYEDMAGVSGYLSTETRMAVTDYHNLCAQSQNERERGTEDDDDEGPSSSLAKLCNDNDDDSDEARDALIKDALANIPDALLKQKENIKDFLESNEDLNSKVKKDEDFTKMLKEFQKITYGSKNKEYDKKSEIIEELKANDDIESAKAALDLAQNKLDKHLSDNASKLEDPEVVKRTQTLTDAKDSASLKLTDAEKKGNKIAFERDLREADKGNFCADYKNSVVIDSVNDCKDDSKPSKCYKEKFEEKLGKQTRSTRRIDRAIASLNDDSASGEWQRIGQRTANTDCQAANESERGIDYYFQQMQQIGGADFSGQRGFGQ